MISFTLDDFFEIPQQAMFLETGFDLLSFSWSTRILMDSNAFLNLLTVAKTVS